MRPLDRKIAVVIEPPDFFYVFGHWLKVKVTIVWMSNQIMPIRGWLAHAQFCLVFSDPPQAKATREWRVIHWTTLEKRCTFVQNARSHLVDHIIWNSTCLPTVEWRLTLAQNVRSHLVEQIAWERTWSPTAEKGHTIVSNARSHLVKLHIWKGTWSVTIGHAQWSEGPTPRGKAL